MFDEDQTAERNCITEVVTNKPFLQSFKQFLLKNFMCCL